MWADQVFTLKPRGVNCIGRMNEILFMSQWQIVMKIYNSSPTVDRPFAIVPKFSYWVIYNLEIAANGRSFKCGGVVNFDDDSPLIYQSDGYTY